MLVAADGVWTRYRLSADARRFLAGELPELPAGELPLRLLAPERA
ncbi:MAG: hypothetical protein ACJ77Z_02970 [Thermoleophilaceae bacterium]